MPENNGWKLIQAKRDGIPLHYKELNALIRNSIRSNHSKIKLIDVFGQRFIAAGVECPEGAVQLEIQGVPGNDLGIFMDGPSIWVKGNAEDQVGNTMNSGTIIIEGDCRDVAGLSMRGGKVFVKGNGGYRIGIHMKEYRDKVPIIVIGGSAGEFFGEYMAGGILLALGLEYNNSKVSNVETIVAPNVGNGIHGGKIYIRGTFPDEYLGVGTVKLPLENEDYRLLKPIIAEFCKYFDLNQDFIWDTSFTKIIAGSHRPFAAYYTAKPI
jgi:glutamate synthase domain-containing protein 3